MSECAIFARHPDLLRSQISSTPKLDPMLGDRKQGRPLKHICKDFLRLASQSPSWPKSQGSAYSEFELTPCIAWTWAIRVLFE